MKKFYKVLLKKACIIHVVTILAFLSAALSPAETYAGSMAADYLVEIGKNFYGRGNYPDALHELNKALILIPEHKEALYYINLIQGIKEEPLATPKKEYIPEELKKGIDKLKQANADLKANNADLKINIERLNQVIDDLKKTKEDILTQDKSLLKEAADLKERSAVLDFKLIELSEKIKELNARLQAMAGELSLGVQEAGQRKKEIAALNQTIAALNKELLALKEENAALKKKILEETERLRREEELKKLAAEKTKGEEELKLKAEEEVRLKALEEKKLAAEKEAERLREEERKRIALEEEKRLAATKAEEAKRIALEEAEKKIAEEKKIVKLEVKPEIAEVVKPPEVIKPEAVKVGIRPEEIKPEEEVKRMALEEERKLAIEKERLEKEEHLKKEEKAKPIKEEVILPEIAPKWIVSRPSEIVTSKGLEDYRLFSEVKVFIEGKQVEITPVIIKDSDIWLPLEEVAKALGLVVIYPEKDALTIINSKGVPLEFNIDKKEVLLNKKPFLTLRKPLAIYKGNFMLHLDSLQEMLGISCEYSADTNIIKITTAEKAKFSTFTVEKPIPPMVKEEKVKKIEAEPRLPRGMKEELLPKEYYPDIDVKIDSNFRYFGDMLETKRIRYTEYYLNGKTYGADVFGHLSMRDFETSQKRSFRENGEHLSFFKGGTGIKLLDNYIRLPGLRAQSQSYLGTEINLKDLPVKSYAWIGEMYPVYIPSLESGGSVKYLGNLYASKQDWLDTPQFRLSALELFTDSHSELSGDSGLTAYPRRNFVHLWDSDWQIWPKFNLYNTFAQSIYAPDNKPETTSSDFDLKSGMKFNSDRFSADSSFEFVGDKYASLGNSAVYQDLMVWDAYTNFEITDNLNLNVSGNINRDNVAFDDAVSTSFNKGISTSANLRLPQRQSLNFGWGYNRHITSGGFQEATGSQYNSYTLNYYKALETASLQLGWRHYIMDPLATSTGGTSFDTYYTSIYKSFPKLYGSYIRFYQDATQTEQRSATNSITNVFNTDISGKYYLLSYLGLTGNCRIRTTQQKQAQDTSLLSFTSGLDYTLSPDLSAGVTYEVSNIDLYAKPRQRTAKDWSILYYLRYTFDFRTPEKWGKVKAYVFEDMNGNNIRDVDERGLKDLLAYVVEGRGVKTNSEGVALINKVAPGKRQVRLDIRGLPFDMIIKDEPTKDVTVEPFKTSAVAFVVVNSGAIEGRIFVDTNNNWVFDKDIDTPMPNVRIYLTPEYKDTLSFSDGSYRFDYVYPGQHKVNIDLEWVAREYRLISSEAKDIKVKPKEAIKNIDFIFESRPIEVKYF